MKREILANPQACQSPACGKSSARHEHRPLPVRDLGRGDFEHNLARFEEGPKRADAEGAKVFSFPECFFTGYPDTKDVARTEATKPD